MNLFKNFIQSFLYKNFYFFFNYYRKYKIKSKNNSFKKRSINLFEEAKFEFFGDPRTDWENNSSENKLIINILKNSDVFINIGANIGFFCCLSMSLKKHTIAIEPIRENIDLLIKNLEVNDYNSVEIYPLALADKNSFTEIYGHGVTASLFKNWDNVKKNRIKEKIPTLMLDTLLENRFNDKQTFIMLDNENAQYLTLLGSKKILNMKIKPIWFIEIFSNLAIDEKITSVNETFYKEIFNIFITNDYDCFFCFQKNDEIIKLNGNDIKKIKDNNVDWVGGQFLFVDKNKIENLTNNKINIKN